MNRGYGSGPYGGQNNGRGPPPYSYGGPSPYGPPGGHNSNSYGNYPPPPSHGYGAPPQHYGQGSQGSYYNQQQYPQQPQQPPPPQPGYNNYGGNYSGHQASYPSQQAPQPGYGQQQTQQAPPPTQTTVQQTQPTANALPVPTAPSQPDYTQYYKQFWEYAAYYGEAHARTAYGLYAPPEGTKPPPGITLPIHPNPPPK